jgi:uncharacterized protein
LKPITYEDIAAYLKGHQLHFEVLEHPASATSDESFAVRAEASGRPVTGAKALVLWASRRSSKELILVVARGSDRLSSPSLRRVLRNHYGEKVGISFASGNDISVHLRGLEIGRVPPFGAPLLPAIVQVVVDDRVFDEKELGFNAAEFVRSIVLSAEALRTALRPEVLIADVAETETGQVRGGSVLSQFHLAFPVTDLEATATFYRGLGCGIGRRNSVVITIDFFGNQLAGHRVPSIEAQNGIYPRHFGAIVDLELLTAIHDRLRALTPETTSRRTRFEGSEIEHETVLAIDPSGNQLEFKHYRNSNGALGSAMELRIGDTNEAPVTKNHTEQEL